jgi:hypothetical protein
VAIGHAECPAPSDWAKTPDRCAPPPLETKAAPSDSASASAEDEESPEAKRLGREKFRAIKSALQHAFPSSRVTPHIVGLVADLLHAPPAPPPPGRAATTMETAPITRRVHEKEHKLYLGQATHHRVKSPAPASRPMESEFMLELPIVRVPLPDKLTAENTRISTEIGDVDFSNDHLLGSVDLLAAKYVGPGYLAARPARVDLLTPARALGTRFGAISVYLGYKNATDKGPSFYILEAGTATGDAKMVYFSPDMKPIPSVTSYYLPTPFVSMRNTYSGGITMQAAPNEDEPATLLVESRAPGEKDPYITVTVHYKRSPEIELPVPVELIADAAARVALVAREMGVPSGEPLERVLADLAKSYYWLEYPRYEGAPATSAAPSPPR